jgi:hypothetical protein
MGFRTTRLKHCTGSLNTKVNWNYICILKISPYRAVNTRRLVYKNSQLMLYREIIAVCSEIRMKHVTLCELYVEFLLSKLVVSIVTIGLLRVNSR